MGEAYRAKVFKSGNSLALRLPKALGFVEGAEMLLREEQGRYTVEAADAPKRKFDVAGIAGTMPGLRYLRPDDRMFEERSERLGDRDDPA